jgi:hypothetical protein|tara:strand:- start:5535 stop:5777 length:243 start_codon:yes stop_codon:yes gene_type:complete
MKAVKIKTAVVGKDDTKGLQKPRFRLYSGETDSINLMVAHYGVSPKFVNQQPEVEVTNVYKVVDILNECIDDYHERHKDD